jgi:hypothetical protein
MVTGKCEVLSAEEVKTRIHNFVPNFEETKEMYKVLKNEVGIDYLLAIEVDHCPYSFACLI